MHFTQPTLPALLILLLAHMRVSRLFILDTFPLFSKPRDWLFLRRPPEDSINQRTYRDEDGHWLVATDGPDGLPTIAREPSLIGELFSCHWCLPFYVGAVQTILYTINPDLCLALCLPFALGMFTGGMWKRLTS